jgi:hypothetical protein
MGRSVDTGRELNDLCSAASLVAPREGTRPTGAEARRCRPRALTRRDVYYYP